jgi:hypothetical protein
VKRSPSRRVVVGVEADRLELKTWGRSAQFRRLDLDAWIKRALNEAAEQDEARRLPAVDRCEVGP